MIYELSKKRKKILIYRSNSPNKNDKKDDSELVNIDSNNINNKRDKNMIKQLDELNWIKKEWEKNFLENEKLNYELIKKTKEKESPIKNRMKMKK